MHHEHQSFDATAPMSPFLQLPLEIRALICEYCLVVDYEITPYPSPYEISQQALLNSKLNDKTYGRRGFKASKPNMPNVNLLQVNKTLHHEAAPILYGKNRWQLPAHFLSSDFDSFDPFANIFQWNRSSFRYITVCFDWRDLMYAATQAQLLNPTARQWEHHERVEASHELEFRGLQISIETAASMLSRLLPQLSNLVIDVTNLYCPHGCCRQRVMTDWFQNLFMRRIGYEVAMGSLVSRIVFKGLINTTEKKLVYREWGFQKDGTVNRAVLARKWGSDLYDDSTIHVLEAEDQDDDVGDKNEEDDEEDAKEEVEEENEENDEEGVEEDIEEEYEEEYEEDD